MGYVLVDALTEHLAYDEHPLPLAESFCQTLFKPPVELLGRAFLVWDGVLPLLFFLHNQILSVVCRLLSNAPSPLAQRTTFFCLNSYSL